MLEPESIKKPVFLVPVPVPVPTANIVSPLLAAVPFTELFLPMKVEPALACVLYAFEPVTVKLEPCIKVEYKFELSPLKTTPIARPAPLVLLQCTYLVAPAVVLLPSAVNVGVLRPPNTLFANDNLCAAGVEDVP